MVVEYCMQDIWRHDADNAGNASHNAESPTRSMSDNASSRTHVACSVLTRAMGLVDECERTYSGCTVLLFSHGDTLQVAVDGWVQ